MTRRRKLSDDQVRQIRASHRTYKHGRGYGALAQVYGVGASTIRDVVQLATYVSVKSKSKAQAAVTARASDQFAQIGL
ncbi:hypothetical protein [Undibacterium sp. TJN19]|uniref:hypothetical protein n=1 Tax=Undibacterium sp. TJN19 TaxID=3413055 RepID=UPI003BEFE238